jgi:predicted RNA-binding protein YlxR (DUF448 family)
MINNTQKAKKIPMRQCLGCNEHKPKREMIRVVRDPEGVVSLDFNGKKSGRGAYICPSAACFAKARKAKRIEHVLECSIPTDIYDEMEQSIASADQG